MIFFYVLKGSKTLMMFKTHIKFEDQEAQAIIEQHWGDENIVSIFRVGLDGDKIIKGVGVTI